MKLKKIFTLTVIGIILLSLNINGQDLSLDYQLSSRQLSVQAAQFSKYGNIPAKHFVGELDMTVPLYLYKDVDFVIPISLCYNNDGFKPNENEGMIGLGWSLNVGGAITRKINGAPDEESQSSKTLPIWGLLLAYKHNIYKYDIPFKQKIKEMSIEALCNAPSSTTVGHNNPSYKTFGGGDLAPDEFNFSMPGHTGKFIVNYDGTIQVKGGKPYQVKFSDDFTTSSKFKTITIVAMDGFQYIFGGQENATELSIFFPDGKLISNQNTITTSWFLKKIIAPNKREVEFIYRTTALPTGQNNSYIIGHESIILRKNMVSFTTSQVNQKSKEIMSGIIGDNMGYTYELIRQTYLEKIIIDKNTTIDFQYKPKPKFFYRNEYINPTFQTFNVKSLSLSEINISYNNTPVKNIVFEQKDLGNSNTRFFLENVKIDNEKYIFDYYNVSSIPYPDPTKVDHWGYYNGSNNGDNMGGNVIPYIDNNYAKGSVGFNYFSDINNVRKPNEESNKIGLLKRIIYPTGGGSSFFYGIHKNLDYEVHKANWDSERLAIKGESPGAPLLGIAGGVRIETIRDFDENGIVVNQRNFHYNKGVLVRYPCYIKEIINIGATAVKCYTQPTSRDIYPIDKHVQYGQVIEVTENGSIIYNYTSYIDEENRDLYKLNIPFHIYNPKLAWYPLAEIMDLKGTDRSYRRGLLKEKIYLNVTSDTIYKEKIKYDIISSSQNNYTLGVRVGEAITNKYLIENYAYLPVETKKYEYRNGTPIVSTDQITYNDSYFIKQKTDVDNGLLTEYKYVVDLKSTAPYSDMTALNIINPIVEKRISKSGNVLTEQMTSYSSFDLDGNRLYLISATYSKNRGEMTRTLHTKFNNYDALGNPVSITTKDNLNSVYLWGYKGLYPIAEIINATYAEVNTALGQEANSFYTAVVPDTSKIEALRSKLPNAYITTYLYKPLIGISQKKDPQNIYTFYEYDNYHRLKKIKDTQQKILSDYAYNQTPFIPLDIWVSVDAIQSLRYPLSVTAQASGGSGTYIYSWYIKGASGSILNQQVNTTNPSYSYKFNDTGKYTLICIIEDTQSGKTKEFSKIIDVVIPTVKLDFYTAEDYLKGTSQTFTAKVIDGSGSFRYNWYLKDLNNIILSKLENSTADSYKATFTQKGIMNMVCQVKDQATGLTVEISKTFLVRSMMLNINYTGIPTVNTQSDFTMSVTDGSGNYRYNWKLIEKSTNNILTQYTATSPNNKFNPQLTKLGEMNVTCNVVDITTGNVEDISETIQVIPPPIVFSNIQRSGSPSSGILTITGDINCYESVNVKFSLGFSGTGSATYQIGSMLYNNINGTQIKDIDLPVGKTTVTLTIRKNPGSSSTNAWISLDKINSGNNTIGIERVLNLVY